MGNSDKLENLLHHQRKITDELVKEISKIESSELFIENNSLKKELNECKNKLEILNANYDELKEENSRLKNSLYQQLYNEKIAILNAVNKKVEAYFQANVQGEYNRLKVFENNSRCRINRMVTVLRENNISDKDEIFKKIEELNYLLNKKIAEARYRLSQQVSSFSQIKSEEYIKLTKEGLSEKEVKSALKKNNIESLVGLNVANIIGILFLIIGVIAGFKFSYTWLPDVAKSILVFVTGTVFIVVGEVLNRRRPNVFSLGMSSAGIAISYAADAFSYFGLQFLNMYLALVICILITVVAFTLSQRYKSQTVATFALVGGYLPLFSISQSEVLVYSSMVYFIILNIFALSIASRKKWSITASIGLFLNIIGTATIMEYTIQETIHFNAKNIIGLIYIVFAFAVYTIIPVISTYITKIKLKKIDVVILGINTFISTILLYAAFYVVNLNDFTGILAVFFAVSYIFLGRFTNKKMVNEKSMSKLFYLTGLTFVVLIIPFQFDKVWLSLGWLVEGVSILTYGVIYDKRNFKQYGYIISGLCLAAFVIVDLTMALVGVNELFVFQYFFITLGSMVVVGAYIYNKILFDKSILALKYCATINLWFFMLYIIGIKLSNFLQYKVTNDSINVGYMMAVLCITIGFVYSYIIPRIVYLSDFGMKIISTCILLISILWLIILNGVSSPIRYYQVPVGISIFGSIILIIISIMSILSLMDFIKRLVIENKLRTEWYPLIISAYFLFVLTQNLVEQYNLDFSSFIISIIYMVIAVSMIIFGFVQRYTYIRIFGLGLTFLAIAKLFIQDLSFLTQGYRIISYFAFGISLITISFVYQYFNKRIDVNRN